MLQTLICLIKGHKLLCRQDYVLGKENVIQHAHVCLRCKKVNRFPDEPVADELLTLLVSLVGQPTQETPDVPERKPLLN